VKRKCLYAVTVVLVLVAAMFAVACAGGEGENELLGAWTHTDVDVEVAFNSDGTMVMSGLGQVQQATYTVEGDTINMVDPETGEAVQIRYTVDGDTLTTDDGSSVDTFVRKESDTTAGETDPTAAQSGDLGTRENPIPLGQEAQVGDWKVTVTGATLDATDQFTDSTYEPLDAGSQIVLIDLTATYVGEDSGTFMMDMIYDFVGSGGNTYDWLPMSVDPDITDEGEVFPDASVSGLLSFVVASDQVSGGTLSLEEFSFDGERVFFAVE
jgi:opacity protein-like surface antigen